METKEITIEPKVDSAQEFIEIALDFSNPLDLVREAISNAFDAEADNIVLSGEITASAAASEQEDDLASMLQEEQPSGLGGIEFATGGTLDSFDTSTGSSQTDFGGLTTLNLAQQHLLSRRKR